MILDTTRKSGRGLPKCTKQFYVTKKVYILWLRGTFNVAELVGDAKDPGIISISLYDKNPLYLMSVVYKEIKWLNIHHKIFYKTKQKIFSSPFYRINVIDDYNRFMGNIDIADQMRGSYSFYHWMRKRKWWWSVLF